MKMCGLGMGMGMGSLNGQSQGVDYHPELGVVNYRVVELGNSPDGQVGQTIQVMRDRVREDSQNPEFQQWAQQTVGDGTNQDKIQRAFGAVKRNIKFQQDRDTGTGVGGIDPGEVVEVIVRPLDMMGYVKSGCAVGDCDDFSMYTAALLESQGIPCSFVTVGADGRDTNQYSHVYVAAYPDGERVAMDCSHGSEPGWEVPNQFGKYREWPINGGDGDLGILGMIAVGAASYWLYDKVMR